MRTAAALGRSIAALLGRMLAVGGAVRRVLLAGHILAAGRILAEDDPVGCSFAGCGSGARAGLGSCRIGCRSWTFCWEVEMGCFGSEDLRCM